ncbi:MAG: YfcE family phosphodiesterase [Desulfurococcales archaeon]|nr:YfcE family phosphodiesterase [Desulfurococcales archaeon]
MKIIVVSDTHGELDQVNFLVGKLRGVEPDLVIHLGDDSPDADPIVSAGFKVIRVPGVFEEVYKDFEVINRVVVKLSDWYVLLTHTPESHKNDLPTDPKPEELVSRKAVDAVFHGHTHIPRLEKVNGVVYLNPGHLKKSDKKGWPATYALVTVGDEELSIEVRNLSDDSVLLSKVFRR